MTTHLEENLRRDLDRIRQQITAMSDVAVGTLQDCVKALDEKNRQLAFIIILRDQRIDHMEKEIDRSCLEFIVRHQPVGVHLRFAYASLQVNLQLERIGDYAESIARQVIKLVDLQCQIPTGLFTDITSASISMLRNAVTAFVRQDADLAGATAQIEEKVDVLQNQVNSEVMHLVQINQIPLAAMTPLLTVARRFERVSDQAKSMCQETLYICTGEYAKHQGSQIYRVLFVDDDHGCLSQMAEAIGNALGHREFEFSSAGLQPRPLDPKVVDFLRQKGLSLPIRKPNPVPTGFEIQEFRVVIALTRNAQRQIPTPPRKTVQLEWVVEEPGSLSGSAEEFTAGAERAYQSLSKQIFGFVTALLGEEPSST